MTIDILLSTYNGEKYIEQQIHSILQQSRSDWVLLIRDDLSHDSTPQLIHKLQYLYPQQIKIIDNKSTNLGASQSFSKLLEKSESDYVMFCDQDDVWVPNKIELTISKIQELEYIYSKETPLLVHSDLKVVDHQLNLIKNSFWKHQNLDPKQGNFLNRTLVQNVITGCTVMINQPLRQLATPIPNKCIMHDWWIALVAAAFGKIAYMETPTVLYRQHQSNSIGSKKWGIKYIFSRAANPKKIKIYFEKTICQAQAFLDIYHGSLDIENLKLVETYSKLNELEFFQKRAALLKNGYYELGSLRNLGLFLAI
jgi:glycosyltransferase involved in cell wall biosynthesis